MWRKPIIWLPALLVLVAITSVSLVSRKAEAEVTELRAPRSVVWKDYLGVNAQFHFFSPQVQEKQMQAVNDLGLEWVRIAMHWAILEPQKDQFNLAAFDGSAQSMERHGLKPIGFLAGSAPFATSAPPGDEHSDQYPPKDPQLYVDSLLKFAHRYPTFQAWQVWNEPNIYPYWRPKEDAAAYARLLFASADELKAQFPDKPVLTAGMAYFSQMPYTNNELMLKLLLEAGLAQRDLVVAYHPYTEKPEGDVPADRDFLARVQFVNNALRAHGIKQVWATEWGWSSYDGPKEMQAIIGTAGQADYTLRRLALMSALDFDRTFLFNLSDLPTLVGPRDQKYGILDLEGNPKPLYAALKNFFAVTGPKLDPADAPDATNLPNDLYSIAWKRSDGKNVWMLWSAKGKSLVLPGVAKAVLHDPLTGKKRTLTASDGGMAVPLKTSLQMLVW